ncbi:MAG: hypothetical protein ACK5Q5_04185 [Planctomycetaceae bacterium]
MDRNVWAGAKLIAQAMDQFVGRLHDLWRTQRLLVTNGLDNPRTRHKIAFAPQSLK